MSPGAMLIKYNGKLINLNIPHVMGVINFTEDSFYEASRVSSIDAVLKRVDTILNEGGNIVDIGACSTRPGSIQKSPQDELNRLSPVLRSIRNRFPDIVISIDTYWAEVVEQLYADSGCFIVNDISGGTIDAKMFQVVAKLGLPYIIGHIQGRPTTMQSSPVYADVVGEIIDFFSERIKKLSDSGCNDILIDPGFGFGKTIEHNYEMVNKLQLLDILEQPIVVGVSRKSMIYQLLHTSSENALNGTTVLNTIALLKGASIIRVHDVKEAVEAVKIVQMMKES